MNFIDPKQIKHIIDNFNEPVIFKGYIDNWKILKWSLNDWEQKLVNTKLQFRKYHFIKSTSPIWEQTCTTTHLTMKEFINFQSIQNDSWLYFDYKYMEEWFKKYTDILNDISWENFGYPEMTGKDSTIWIGTNGAHTPCHMDTYGCNLIAQVYGKKRWIIFPPKENLQPTRVPYEESSVYSKLNFFSPNVEDFKGVKNGRTVVLNPGEVLFLPSSWWHYVENIETAISVNVWLPQPEDDRKRIEEAFTQILVSQLTKILDKNEQTMILNPNSMEIHDTSLSNSLNLLDQIIDIYKNKKMFQKQPTEEKQLPQEQETIEQNTEAKQSPQTIDAQVQNSIKSLKNNITTNLVPKLSDQEFQSLLKDQQMKYFSCSEVESDENKSSNVTTIEKIINAVCHPEILALIGEKLLKN